MRKRSKWNLPLLIALGIGLGYVLRKKQQQQAIAAAKSPVIESSNAVAN